MKARIYAFMNILIVSDIHEDIDMLMYRLLDDHIDACISCGDLTPSMKKNINIPKPIYSVYGNNEDWDIYNSKIKNLRWMTAGKIYDVKGIKVAGMGGVMSRTPRKPSHYTNGEVKSSLALGPNSVDVFVTHHPPKLYADFRVDIKKHCGSHDVLKILAKVQPKLFLSGHLHWEQMGIFGSNGVVTTYVVTLGRFKHGDYAILNRKKLRLYKKGIHCLDIYWRHHSV